MILCKNILHMEKETLKDNIKIKSFHDDNGVFKSKRFMKNI